MNIRTTNANSNAPALTTTDQSARTQLTERIGPAKGHVGSTFSDLARAAVDGVSATVSFSGEALHALEQASDVLVDGFEDVAVGAWHTVQKATAEIGQVGQVAVDALEDVAHDVASATKSAAQELGHYVEVGMQTVGEGVSELASGAVMAASAGGQILTTRL